MNKMSAIVAGLVVATSSSAFAESWGDVGNMSSVYAKHDDRSFAKICFDNRLGPSPNTRTFNLSYDGVTFQVEIDHGSGMEPDTMTVTTPLWLVSSPPYISVEENSVGCVFIMEQLLG